MNLETVIHIKQCMNITNEKYLYLHKTNRNIYVKYV